MYRIRDIAQISRLSPSLSQPLSASSVDFLYKRIKDVAVDQEMELTLSGCRESDIQDAPDIPLYTGDRGGVVIDHEEDVPLTHERGSTTTTAQSVPPHEMRDNNNRTFVPLTDMGTGTISQVGLGLKRVGEGVWTDPPHPTFGTTGVSDRV